MRIIELEIKNWEKHNPRTDVKATKWFKMSNDFFNDPEFYGISLEARTIWLFLLCVASKASDGKIKINTQMIADNIRSNTDSVDFAILELEQCGSILTKPVTLITNDLQPERKDKVTIFSRALEEKREEEKRREEKRKEICSEPAKPDSKHVAIKVLGPIVEFQNSELNKALLKSVPQDTQELWLTTYQDVSWIQHEFIKIVNWLKVNPNKAPKSRPDRFISNWLSRGWESHRKTLPHQFMKPEHRTQTTVSAQEIERAKQLGII